jgi:hypothetical protein
MKFPYTEDEVVLAINKFQNNSSAGICLAFVSYDNNCSYSNVPKFLRTLGGKSKWEWFWLEPYYSWWNMTEKKKVEQARAQRATMLAFMLAWSQDPDFEV